MALMTLVSRASDRTRQAADAEFLGWLTCTQEEEDAFQRHVDQTEGQTEEPPKPRCRAWARPRAYPKVVRGCAKAKARAPAPMPTRTGGLLRVLGW
jgi:hypothetical protein